MSTNEVCGSNPPSLPELLKNQLDHAGKRDKTVNIKITNNTARMILERDARDQLLDACKKVLWDSSLNDSPTFLSHEVHKMLNDAVMIAEPERQE